MPIDQELHRGMVCRHHSGRVYTVLHVTNDVSNPKPNFPVTVVYLGANGNMWSRRLDEFKEKFDVIFDGTNLADPVEQRGLPGSIDDTDESLNDDR